MAEPGIPESAGRQRRWTMTAVTGAQNTASRRPPERRGFRLTGPLPGTDEVRCTLSLSQPGRGTAAG